MSEEPEQCKPWTRNDGRRPYTAADKAFLVESYSRLSVEMQAAAINRTPGSVKCVRRQLLREGKVSPHERAQKRAWSDDEREIIQTMLRKGAASSAIVAALPGRTAEAYQVYMERKGGTVTGTRQRFQVYTSRQAARILGISNSTMIDWIRAKVIKAKRPAAPLSMYRITSDWLRAFLVDRSKWPWVAPERMTDPYWRGVTLAARAEADGTWMSIADAALGYYVCFQTLYKWLERYGRDYWQIERVHRGKQTFLWRPKIGLPPPPRSRKEFPR